MDRARTERSEGAHRPPAGLAALDFLTAPERLRLAFVYSFELIVAVAFILLAIILLLAIFW